MRDFFFALLRSSLFGVPVCSADVPANVDWREVISLASRQAVMGLVFDAVSRLPADFLPPAHLRARMMELSLRVVKSHSLLDESVAEVVDFYQSRGVDCVLLKGQGVARCYENPQLRQCGDVDLYVGVKNYPRAVSLAIDCLVSAGSDPSETVKHYHFNRGGVSIELHRLAAIMHNPFSNRRMQRWIKAQLDDPGRLRHLDFNGSQVPVPSAEFNAVFVFYHAWYHLMNSGIGIRHFCDLAMVLHDAKDSIDRGALAAQLEDLGLVKPWQLFGCIVVDLLGLPADEFPLYSPAMSGKSAAVLSRVMTGGNFGFFDPNRSDKSGKSLVSRKLSILVDVLKAYRNNFSMAPVESTCHLVKLVAVGGINTLRLLVSSKAPS